MLRIALLPPRLAVASASLSARLGFRAGRMSARATRAVGRRAGWGLVAAFGGGVVVGLLVSRTPGGSLRRAVGRRLRGGASDAEVAEAVRFELAHAPRTWHLEQPAVEVAGRVVTLRGSAQHEAAVEALERVVRSVPDVEDVVVDLVVG